MADPQVQKDPTSIIGGLPIDQKTKADLWEATNSSNNENDFGVKLQGFKIPQQAKADLWEWKKSSAANAQPKAASTQPVIPDNVMQNIKNSAPTQQVNSDAMNKIMSQYGTGQDQGADSIPGQIGGFNEFIKNASEGVDQSAIIGGIKTATGISGLKVLSNLLSMAGKKGKEQAEYIDHLGRTGVISPNTAAMARLPGGIIDSIGRIGSNMATPEGAIMTAASVAPQTRIPAAIYGAITSAKSMQDASEQPMTADKVEQMLLGGSGLAASAAIGASGAASVKARTTAPIPHEQAVPMLRQAFNPGTSDAGYLAAGDVKGAGFMGEADNVLNKVVDHARKTGSIDKLNQAKSTGQSQQAVADSTKMAAKDQPYYKQIFEPNKAVDVSTPQGYAGESVTHGRATIEQLESRLSTINSTLQPKFVRGGAGSISSQAAVSAEQAAALQSEGGAIRQTLNNELGKRTGIPPDQVGQMRQDYGQMRDLADTMQYHANETTQAEIKAKNTPVKLKDVIPGANIENLLGKAGEVPVRPSNWRRSIQTKTLQDVFNRYQSAKPPFNINNYTPSQDEVKKAIPEWLQQLRDQNAQAQGQKAPAQVPMGQTGAPAVPQATADPSAPAIPAGQPGLLRPGTGPQPPSSTPLPYGPEGQQPAMMRTPVRPTVLQENPEISPLSLGKNQSKSLMVGTKAGQIADTNFFQQAREQLGPKAKISDIAQLAQKFKDQANALPQNIQNLTGIRKLPSDFKISADESVNGTDLTMKDLNGKKMGTIGIRDSEPIGDKTVSEVGDISLNKENRSKGYGQALYEKAAQHAANSGDDILVSSGSPTSSAKSTWKRLQAAHPNEIKFSNGRWQWDLSGMK